MHVLRLQSFPIVSFVNVNTYLLTDKQPLVPSGVYRHQIDCTVLCYDLLSNMVFLFSGALQKSLH